MKNKRIVLAARPQGMPRESDFRLEEVEIPDPEDGQILVRNHYASVDPGARDRLSGEASYVAAQGIGEVMGSATVSEVVASRNSKFAVGDFVAGVLGWQDYSLSDGRGLRRIEDRRVPISAQIGVLGIPGLTAYFGLLRIGALQAGDTVLVSSAAGAVGSAVGQIAKIKGARAVGIAGSPEKCCWLTEELGFDAAIDRRAEPDMGAAIARTCPEGVDVLFDNVGNALIEAALPHMRQRGRIVNSGMTADYNVAMGDRPGLQNTRVFITQRLRMEGFIVFDFADELTQARNELTDWILADRLRYREDIDQGVESLPAAFVGLFKGDNFGRKLVRLDAG
jgi:NADPH-dependent curcumin reductase CurA